MKNLNFLETYQTIRFIDHSKTSKIFDVDNTALTSFAIDDAITTAVGDKTVLPTIRLWVHQPTLVLGIPDSRLPYIHQAVDFVKSHDRQVVIRNSGGLAVYLDPGVLNMSMVIPNDKAIDIHDGYHMMHAFIQNLFVSETSNILAYEIVGSYCPGDYDLSVNGIKFAGISQRRIRNGIAIQIYMDIEGDSPKRASFVKQFYKIGKKNEQTAYTYPDIKPETMGTISQLTNTNLTVNQVKRRIQNMLKPHIQNTYGLTDKEQTVFAKRYQQMVQRNTKI